VLGKLLFKRNCLQLLVTGVKKKNYLLYFLQNLKCNMLQLQLLFTSTEITFVLHSLSCRVWYKFKQRQKMCRNQI